MMFLKVMSLYKIIIVLFCFFNLTARFYSKKLHRIHIYHLDGIELLSSDPLSTNSDFALAHVAGNILEHMGLN